MTGILQVNGHGEESTLMQDLKPFRILISLLDKPELGNFHFPILVFILFYMTWHNCWFFFLLLVNLKQSCIPNDSICISRLAGFLDLPSQLFNVVVRFILIQSHFLLRSPQGTES